MTHAQAVRGVSQYEIGSTGEMPGVSIFVKKDSNPFPFELGEKNPLI
jgi:hypothetical protein